MVHLWWKVWKLTTSEYGARLCIYGKRRGGKQYANILPRPRLLAAPLPFSHLIALLLQVFSSNAQCILLSTPFLRPEANGTGRCSGKELVSAMSASIGFQSLQFSALEIRLGYKPTSAPYYVDNPWATCLTSEP